MNVQQYTNHNHKQWRVSEWWHEKYKRSQDQ